MNFSPSGLHYYFFKKNKKNRQAQTGDVLLYQLVLKNYTDSVILDTRKEFGEQQISITAPNFKGDLMEGLCMLHEGDSVLFQIPVDSLYKNALPFFAKPKTMMHFYLAVNKVMTALEFQQIQANEKQASLNYDDSVLHVYLNKINRVPVKLPSGLYVYHLQKGFGEKIKNGDTIKVNYTGKLLNKKVFDSNTDKAFNHVTPFQFVVGKGEVIIGWDEAFATLNYGAKATLYIPAVLAYGKKQVGNIPDNYILIFDVAVLR